MTAVLAQAIAEWMVDHPGKMPEIRYLRHRLVDPGRQAEVQSDPPGLFAPDTLVVARAGEDFLFVGARSAAAGVVVTVVNVSQTSMPRRFDGWLLGRDFGAD